MSNASGTRTTASEPRRHAGLGDFFIRLWREKPLGSACGIVVVLLILVAVFADVLAPYGYTEIHLADRLQGASARYLLGTDQLGRDYLSRLTYGARLSMLVGLSATTLNVVVAVLIGGISGFLGGKLDLGVQRFVDAWMAFPGLLLLLTIMSILGQGVPQMILVLGISGGIGGSRVVRGAVITVKENDYFQAAASIGSAKWRAFARHVLPNIGAPLIIIFSINIGGAIMSDASLSFLGFGLPPEFPSWGTLLSWEGRRYMEQAPWLALWPGLCLTLVVYSLNMFGDAMRDLLDPGGSGVAWGVWVAFSANPRSLLRRSVAAATAAQAGIEQVAECVTEHIDAVHDDRQAQARPDRQPRRDRHVLASFPAEHATPARHFRRQPEAQGSSARPRPR